MKKSRNRSTKIPALAGVVKNAEADDEVYVLGRHHVDTLDIIKLSDYLYERKPVPTDFLQDQVQRFLAKMQRVLEGSPESYGRFELETVEISAEVSAKGELGLLGSGGELSGSGGLKFTLRVKGR